MVFLWIIYKYCSNCGRVEHYILHISLYKLLEICRYHICRWLLSPHHRISSINSNLRETYYFQLSCTPRARGNA